MSFYMYNGKKMYYQELGTGQPLILLHGNTASSNMFLEVATKYANTYKVILIDFLGHGQSDRLDAFPADLWFSEAEQVISFLKEKQYGKVNIIGSSGGALVAINIALEAPELVNKVIADSFEGEQPLKAFTQNVIEEREHSKQDENTIMFYHAMHGDDWEKVVDNDTQAIFRHDQEIGKFFHQSLHSLTPDILLTGSKKDEFVCAIDPFYFDKVYENMLVKIGHGEMYLFETGGHPAMLSNQEAFIELSHHFFEK